MAHRQPARQLPLHPGRFLVDESDRNLVRHHHSPIDPPWHLHLVKVLIKTIRDYIAHWNADAQPFVWTATSDEILAKVALTQAAVRQLVDNNAK